MTINEYQELALRTANPAMSRRDMLINGVMGLCGESGEVIDMVKKHLAQGHELDRQRMAEELGDVAWYLAETAHVLGFSLEEILQGNIDKLKHRFPEGFDRERSIHRLTLQEYRPEDLPAMERLFYDTVHTVCAGDYSEEQLSAWADGQADGDAWNQSFLAHYTITAWMEGVLAGFADLDESGSVPYLDRLYVHKDYQKRGIGRALAEAMEEKARAAGAEEITVHASITARPFFEQLGYVTERKQEVVRRGVCLSNFAMRKKFEEGAAKEAGAEKS